MEFKTFYILAAIVIITISEGMAKPLEVSGEKTVSAQIKDNESDVAQLKTREGRFYGYGGLGGFGGGLSSSNAMASASSGSFGGGFGFPGFGNSHASANAFASSNTFGYGRK